MRLQRIYSSKLYITSTRKDKIDEVINLPYNKELVQQMSEYLDDAGQAELEHAVSETKSSAAPAADTSDGAAPSGGGSSFPAPAGGASFSGDVFTDFGEDELADVEVPEGEAPAEEPAEEPAAAPTEAASDVTGTPITAASCIVWTTLDDVVSDCETIKGTLNALDTTKGVNRLQVKDSELWIYYSDDANLNDKMVDVIEVLNSTGYTYLVFNRLARSNNAVVFDINLNPSEQVKPVVEVEAEAK